MEATMSDDRQVPENEFDKLANDWLDQLFAVYDHIDDIDHVVPYNLNPLIRDIAHGLSREHECEVRNLQYIAKGEYREDRNEAVAQDRPNDGSEPVV
jgi:hypothetical protein